MKEPQSKETRSFRDPMATRLEAAERRREKLEAQYPQVHEVYDGFYLQLNDLSEEGSRFFLGAEAIIGSRIALGNGGSALFSADGVQVAELSGENALRLSAHAAQGWHIRVFLCATFFNAQEKRAAAELACICWAPLDSPDFDVALSNFSRNIAHRFTKGDRAGLELSQDQFMSVLRSDGAWFLTPITKRARPQKGTVVYRNHRSGTERITGFALRHRTGCNLLASLFWLLVLAGVVALIWYFFFS